MPWAGSPATPDRSHPVRTVVALAVLAAFVPAVLPAQTAADSAGVRAAALDYIEGWYEGNVERMTRALHPELAKRIMATDRGSGAHRLSSMGASTLIQQTERGGGKSTPAGERRTDVRILDIFQGTASVRVDAHAWIDYMHLARDGEGRWVIVNVLWEMRR